MEEIFIDIRNWGNWFKDRFPEKDLVSLDEFLSDYEELIDEVKHLKEELEDLEEDLRENYRRIPVSEQVGISDIDFL